MKSYSIVVDDCNSKIRTWTVISVLIQETSSSSRDKRNRFPSCRAIKYYVDKTVKYEPLGEGRKRG